MNKLSVLLRHAARSPWVTMAPLVAALSCAAALAQPAGAPPEGGMRPAMHHGGGRMGMDSGGMSGAMAERMFDQVGATAEQKAKLRDIMKSAQADLRGQHEEGRKLHEALAAVLAAPKLDANAAEGLRQKIQAHHDVASKRLLQAQLDAGAVLTPEQRQKLAERRQQHRDMMQRHQREREAVDGPRS
jgi:protein CpxP